MRHNRLKGLTITSILLLLLASGALGRLIDCDPSKNTVGPINLDFPMQKKNHFPVEYFFDDVIDPVIEKISHAHFRIVDDFGDIKFGYRKYAIKQIDFYTESLHRIAGQRFPLEMIATAELIPISDSKDGQTQPEHVIPKPAAPKTQNTKTGAKKLTSTPNTPKPTKVGQNPANSADKVLKKLKFSIIFEQATVPFVELYPLGIGRGLLRKLPTKREDPRSSRLPLHTTFNLGLFVDKYKKAVWYSAHSVLDRCELAHFVLMFETLWVSPEQLSEFRLSFHDRIRTSDNLGVNETISTNFISKA